ncbi:hypothetical protein FBU31_001886, partial [Coemansia sp. 'formosensis']
DTEVAVAPLLPSSPDLARPQSLLIPALLSKGMLRSQADPAPTQPKAPPALDLAREVPAASRVGAGDMPFGLGLDLGFDIAQSAAKRGPLSGGGSGMSSSIMEIADFLERDIDVFTPLSARTPRSAAAVPSMPTGRLSVQSPASKQRELIEDIFKLSF